MKRRHPSVPLTLSHTGQCRLRQARLAGSDQWLCRKIPRSMTVCALVKVLDKRCRRLFVARRVRTDGPNVGVSVGGYAVSLGDRGRVHHRHGLP